MASNVVDIEPIWEHQERLGVEAIGANPATYLAWDMGSGKSRPIVEYVKRTFDGEPARILIACPKAVVSVWPAQFARFAPDLDVEILPLGDKPVTKRADKLKSEINRQAHFGRPLVVLVNYDAAWRKPLASVLTSVRWHLIACDEIHRIKSPCGIASRFFGALARQADRRVGLSGTPMPHSPLDVWAQFRFLDPNVFGWSFVRFRARYAVMGGFENRQVLGFKNLEELQALFYSIASRVTLDDVLPDLPKATHTERRFALSPKSRKLYDEVDREFCALVDDGVITASNALVKLLRLSQIANGFVLLDEDELPAGGVRLRVTSDEKTEALVELLDDVPAEEPVVVFARFHHDLDEIKGAAARACRAAYELSGRHKSLDEWLDHCDGFDDRDKSEERTRRAAPVLAVQIGTGSEGVDGLQLRSNYCVFFSCGWSLGQYYQAIGRLRRPGQESRTTVVHLIAESTVDSTICAALAKRREIVESVLDDAKRRATKES